MIIAKPVINKKYWILKKDNCKVGAVEADSDGFVVRIQNSVARYKTMPMVRQKANIEFQPPGKITPVPPDMVHGYSTGCRVHNAVWNVKHRLPLFTKTAKSKSWFAAGWYRVQQGRTWSITKNPKLIRLERYPYQGPFHTEEQANDRFITTVRDNA